MSQTMRHPEPGTMSSPAGGGSGSPNVPISVFVHLARNKDVAEWQAAYRDGTLVGVNDATPYGYGRAERMGCRIQFSRSVPETRMLKLVRLGLRVLTGFDLVHAMRQGSALARADIVWTHTESQYLAVAAGLALRDWFRGLSGRPHDRARPKLLGQSVWLFDRWPRLNPLQRGFYRALIDRVDLLTFHSEENLARARAAFPRHRTALVPFGIPAETSAPPRLRAAAPIRVVAVGSDRHRDWTTLVNAVANCPDIELTILSGTASRTLGRNAPNVRITRAKTNAELSAYLDTATLACVPLKPNTHASGITAVQEAVLAGLPVVASDTGGLRLYFGPEAVRYVPVGDAHALRDAIRHVAADPSAAQRMAQTAQARMGAGGLGAETFVQRHVELSREMLQP